jgi:signal transduction histidine kinase
VRIVKEAGLGVLATLIGVFFLWATISDEPAHGTAPMIYREIAAGVVSFAALLAFRRTRPVALALVLIPAGVLFGLPMGAFPVALFTVGVHRRWPVAVGVAVLHSLTIALAYRLAPVEPRVYIEAVVFMALLDVIVVAIAMLVRSHRRLVRSWADRAREAEEGQRLRIEQARHGERERIAREMHDVLAHRISLLAVHAGALEVRRDAPEPERAAAGVIRQCAHDALEDLRQVIGMLREPDDDHPQPTIDDLFALVEQSREAGTTVELAVPDDLTDMPTALGRHTYRIVQETLTNARKHAPGAPVTVSVSGAAGDGLTITAANALSRTSAGTIPGAGAGLVGLAERTHLAGGRIAHGPTAGGEFRVEAWLPWQT